MAKKTTMKTTPAPAPAWRVGETATVQLDKGRRVQMVREPDGDDFTDAEAEALAAKARAYRQRRGRPSLTGQAKHSPQVAFRVTPEIRKRAERLAQKTGKSLSMIAREAFEDRLRKGA